VLIGLLDDPVHGRYHLGSSARLCPFRMQSLEGQRQSSTLEAPDETSWSTIRGLTHGADGDTHDPLWEACK
jgi:hypothetical protein